MGSSVVTIINSLNKGELAPSVYGRTDLEAYHSGCTTARNFFANYRGGVSSRAGLAYVGMCKQQYPTPPRDIPFQFSLNQGYILEFGDLYMRVKFNGGYVTETAKTVTSVSSAGVFTVAGHGYSIGDWVFDSGNTGFSGLTWIVSATTTNTFNVTDLFGNAVTSATASTGGTVARIYTVVSPYHAVDLPYLKYTQSADVMTLTCVNTSTSTEYAPYDLTRLSNTNWSFSQETFGASLAAPGSLKATATSSTTPSTWYTYVVTSVSRSTGEESVSSSQVSVFNNDIALFAGSNNISWKGVSGADYYNVYAAVPSYQATAPVSSLFGFIGIALGPSFTDTNITPDFTQVPPSHLNPFEEGAITDVVPTAAGTNYSQQTIGYTISTSTGSGFAGTPVAANGGFAGFIITNQGKGYQSGDTITITDSGGGLATGNFSFSGNPANTSTIIFNGGTVITFKNSTTNSADVQIGQTLALTLQMLANFLNSQSANLNLSVATYTTDATHLYITYKMPGTVGNAYTLSNGTGTSNATASGTNLTGGGTVGSGATATLTVGPESGTYPGAVAYFQQRRVYAASLNQPDTYWMSKPGLFNNMDFSIPVTDGDAITGTPWAQQVNGIQFLQPMPGGLVVLTGRGAWQVNGGSQAAITPSNQNATPQAYNGCHDHVPPIVVNYDILYVQAKGSIIRDLSYNFFVNIYTGTDLTVLSNHLFRDFQIVQWAYAEEPYKLIWVIRDDGTALCLTYLKEQEIYGWSRHDTDGLFVGVASITEPTSSANTFNNYYVDAVYFIVQRYIQGAWRYYSERMDNRIWTDVENAFCVDAGLSTVLTYPSATLNVSAATGTVTMTASASVFNSSQVGSVVRGGGGIINVTGYTSGTVLTGTVTQTLSQTVQDDPGSMPDPLQAGTWSIAPTISSVSGLNHLNGLTVTALADGSVIPNQVVTNNSITLPNPASLVTVGLPYTCQVQTMYLDYPSGTGSTVQNRRKNISAVGVRVEATRGIQVGADQPDQAAQQNYQTLPWTGMNEVKDRTQFTFAGNAVPLKTGDYYKTVTSGWDLKGQIAIQQTYPLPANILSVIGYIQGGDDK